MALILATSLLVTSVLSSEVPLRSDIPSIFSRFRQLDDQMGDLRRRVEDLESGALEAEKVAQTTSASVVRSERRATAAATAARRDAQKAGKLGAAFLSTGNKVRAAATQMSDLRQELHALEASVVRLGMYASGLGSKIGTLQDDAREFVPGMGGLGARIDRAEATMKEMQEQVGYPELHGMILADLRTDFRRQQEQVQQLAAASVTGLPADEVGDAAPVAFTARGATAGAGDSDSDGDGPRQVDGGAKRDDTWDDGVEDDVMDD